MAQNAAGDSQSQQGAVVAHPEVRRVLVGISIALVSLTFLAMVGLLYIAFLQGNPKASSLLVFQGDKSVEGAVITLVGSRDKRTCTMKEADGFVCRFPLYPGNYLVSVEHDGQTLLREMQLTVREQQYATYQLRAPEPKP